MAADLVGRARAEDVAVLLYSSGATGTPKGIPLRHRNIVGGILNAEAGGYFRRGERLFADLPTARVGDFVFTLGAGVLPRAAINIPERQETALHDLREVAPAFYLAALAMERKRLKGQPLTPGERVTDWLGNILIYAPIKDFLRLSQAERAYTGGEAMGEDTFLFFRALGIKLTQLCGQTETCALSAAQIEGSVAINSVGRAMPGVEVKIAGNGEILIRSASVFEGYADNPDASAEALTRDGWLHTGDAGYLEPDGDLVVLGRVSELVQTAAPARCAAT